MRKELEKAFQVPESLSAEKIEEENGKTILFCEPKEEKKPGRKKKGQEKKAIPCPHCGGKTIGYDTRVSDKRHTVVGGKTIWLRIKRLRYQCKECKKVFVEPLDGITRSELTDHFVQQIQEKAHRQDQTTIAKEMGVVNSTVCNKVCAIPSKEFNLPKKKSSSSE